VPVDPQFALLDPDGFTTNIQKRGYIIRILPDFDDLFADTDTTDADGNVNGPIHGTDTGPAVLDHRADGPSITDQNTGIPSDLSDDLWYDRFPMDDRWSVVDPRTNATEAMIERLHEMGIYARSYRADELEGQLTWNFLDDTPQTHDPRPQDYTVVAGRIDYADAEEVLGMFDRLGNKDVVTPAELAAIGEELYDMGLTRREIRGSLEVLIVHFNVNTTVDTIMPEDRDPMPQGDGEAEGE